MNKKMNTKVEEEYKMVEFEISAPQAEKVVLTGDFNGWDRKPIGRFLKCSHVSVYNWIKSYGAAIKGLRSNSGVEVVEMDEMHTYVGSKKTTVGFGLLLIDMENDSSTAYWAPVVPQTGKLLWEEVQQDAIQSVMTDEWKPYKEFIPQEVHIQSKAETFTIEGYNSLFRHFLARLRRKSKCYSKSRQMLRYSVMLLMLKWNGELQSILI